MDQIKILKDVGTMKSGSVVWVDKEVASTLVLDGLAERVHQDIHNYNTRVPGKGEAR